MANGLLGPGRKQTNAGLLGEIPRAAFLPPQLRPYARVDAPLPIGAGQTTSQPSTVARMVQALALAPDDKVLEIGTGTGFAAAALAQAAGEVITIERTPELAAQAQAILTRLGLDNVTVLNGDGARGLPAEAPFDAIMVSAAASSVPRPLLAQLGEGGRLVMPLGPPDQQRLVRVTRHGASFTPEDLGAVQFVPMVSP